MRVGCRPCFIAVTDAEHAELAQAVQMCRDNGWERAAFLLARAWAEELKKARKHRGKSERVARGEERDDDGETAVQ